MANPVVPEVARDLMLRAGLEPLAPYPGARAKWLCRCIKCGDNVAPLYTNVRSGHAGCNQCAQKSRCTRRRSSRSTEAAALVADRGLEPLEPYPGWTFPWRCRCTRCGEETSPRCHDLRKQGACRTCAFAAQSVRQMGPEAEAIEALRMAGLEPLGKFPGVMAPWPCECLRCGRRVSPRLNNIGKGRGGCRWCADWGFTATEAVIYLIAHHGFGAAKVGITSMDSRRLRQHAKHGWELLAEVKTSGEQALAVERAILTWWRSDLDLPQFLGRQEMPQYGWTETVELDAVDIPATIERMRALAA